MSLRFTVACSRRAASGYLSRVRPARPAAPGRLPAAARCFAASADDDDKARWSAARAASEASRAPTEALRKAKAGVASEAEATDDKTETGSFADRGRALLSRYGYAFAGTYLTVYVSTLAGLYLGLESGLLVPSFLGGSSDAALATVHSVLHRLPEVCGPFVEWAEARPGFSLFAVAWVATKFTEPLRFGVAVLITKRIWGDKTQPEGS